MTRHARRCPMGLRPSSSCGRGAGHACAEGSACSLRPLSVTDRVMSAESGATSQEPKAADNPWVRFVCTPETFAKVDYSRVRWLDMDADYPLMREAWEVRGLAPAREDCLSWRDQGYEYCALVEDERILAIA